MKARFQVQDLWRKVKDFLLNAMGKEFLVFLFFLALSAGFWLLQTLDETFEAEVKIPLVLVDVPEDVMITTPLPEALEVTVKDKGATLMRYWRHSMQPILISYRDYQGSSTNGMVRIMQSDIQKAVQLRMFSSSRVQSIRPDTLEFFFNHGRNSMIPVTVAGKVETNPQYYLLDVSTTPSEVRVFAPSSMLDTLLAVRTVDVNLTDLKENKSVEVALQPIRGAKIEPSTVTLTAMVDVYMEDVVEIPIVSLNFPAGKHLRTFPPTVKVTYTVGYSRSKDVKKKNFVSVITYEDLLVLQEEGATKIPVRLKTIPEGVTNVRIEPSELDFLVETVNEDE